MFASSFLPYTAVGRDPPKATVGSIGAGGEAMVVGRVSVEPAGMGELKTVSR